MIENFIGFPDGIGGAELARLAGRQAENFGASSRHARRHGPPARPRRHVHAVARWWYRGRGARGHRRARDGVAPAEVDGVDDLLDRGVYYGAGRSEAAQCGGDDVVVVGAGNSAGQAAMNMAGAGARVRMLVRGDALGKTMSATW